MDGGLYVNGRRVVCEWMEGCIGMDGGLYGNGWRGVWEWMEGCMGRDGGLYVNGWRIVWERMEDCTDMDVWMESRRKDEIGCMEEIPNLAHLSKL